MNRVNCIFELFAVTAFLVVPVLFAVLALLDPDERADVRGSGPRHRRFERHSASQSVD